MNFATRNCSNRKPEKGNIGEKMLLHDMSESCADESTSLQCSKVIAEVRYYLMTELDRQEGYWGSRHDGGVRCIVGSETSHSRCCNLLMFCPPAYHPYVKQTFFSDERKVSPADFFCIISIVLLMTQICNFIPSQGNSSCTSRFEKGGKHILSTLMERHTYRGPLYHTPVHQTPVIMFPSVLVYYLAGSFHC